MIYTKGILLKGLLGFGAASAAVYGGLTQKEKIAGWFSSGDEPEKPAAAITADASKLLDEVGLSCDLTNATATAGVDCSKKTGNEIKIKVKKDSDNFEVSNLPASGGGKIKVYKDEGQGEDAYNQGLKFVIEDGDISASAGDKKLEEFETYEIKEDNTKKYYLTRKTEAKANIKKALGLPDACELPTTAPCTVDSTKINDINFDGKQGTITGSGSLKIDIATSSEKNDFPLGYKFTLTPSGDITINRSSGQGNIVLKNSVATVFKIKKNGTSLTLEEAWTQESLTKKVGLQCTAATDAGVDCSKAEAADAKVKVKQESNTFELSSLGSGGKIKLYKAGDTDGYNKGLKFVIEGGDISGTGDSNKLEEFETYEIKEHSGTHHLTRKKKSSEEKRRILGLPDNCVFPEGSTTSKDCTVNTANINNIKFDGKTNATLSEGTATLKVEVTPSTETTEFPHGFKFTLTPSAGTLTITKSSETITIKANEGKQFKINKSGTSLTLEKAWTLTTLASKVGLTCTESGGSPTENTGVECTKASGNTKVKKNGSSDFNVSTISEGKIKAYKTSSGETYNEGFKFVIEENDINGDGSNKLEQFETYEIKNDSNEWKLVRKSDAKAGIKKALGLDQIDGCDLPAASSDEKTCNLDESKFKKIKFEGRVENQMSGGASAKLKISKPSESENSDFGPFGYKFKLESDQDVNVSSSTAIKGKTNTEFKIKRATGSNEITLEKALDVVTLGKKVNLTCTANGGGSKECTLGEKINVKDGNNSKKDATFKNGNGSKKLTYELDQQDYNQGIKFTTTTEICLENGGQSSGSPTSIANGGTGYEIKKEGNDWFLVKKDAAQ